MNDSVIFSPRRLVCFDFERVKETEISFHISDDEEIG